MAAQHHFRLSQRHQQAKTWPSNTTDELSGADRPRHGLMPMRFSPSASSASHGLACSRRRHLHQRVHLSHFAKHTATRGRSHIRTAQPQHTTARRVPPPKNATATSALSMRHQVITVMQSNRNQSGINQAETRSPPRNNRAATGNAQPVRSETATLHNRYTIR